MTTKMNLFASAIVAAGVAMSSGAMTNAEAEKLIKTPIAQITDANAQVILDAAVQVTNCIAPVNVAGANVFSVQEMLSKLDGFPSYMEEKQCFKAFVLSQLAQNPASTPAERIDLFNRYVDYWLSKPADVRDRFRTLITKFMSLSEKGKPEIRLQSTGPEAVAAMAAGCEKLAASGLPDALGQVGHIVFQGKTNMWKGIDGGEALIEKWGPKIVDVMKAGKLKCSHYWFNVASWLLHEKKDVTGCISLLESRPDLYTMSSVQTEKGYLFYACPQRAGGFLPAMKEFGSRLRTSWLKNGSFKTDFAAIRVAKEQDKWAGDKTATAEVWEKLTECSNRVEVACYLGDAGKVIDALCEADESLTPETVMKAVQVINSLDPDFRSADVKKALRVVNKKYTLKLYDDRDAWEPVLSKVRALLDTYGM